MKKSYEITLLNKSEVLDLRTKKEEIENGITYILNGGKTTTSFKNVRSININTINKSYIVLEVEEENGHWHKHFGKKLKEIGMEEFCLPYNPNRMFKWNTI